MTGGEFTAEGLEMLRAAGFPVAGVHDRPGDRDRQRVCACGLDLDIWQNDWNHAKGCPMQPLATARVDEAARRDKLVTDLRALADDWDSAPRTPGQWRPMAAARLRAVLDADRD